MNKYEGKFKEPFNSSRGENSLMVKENLVSYFHARAYNDINDIGETMINPANSRSSATKLSTRQF